VHLRLLGNGPGPSVEASGLIVALQALSAPAIGGGGPVASAREPRLLRCPAGTEPRGFSGCVNVSMIRSGVRAHGNRHAATHFARDHRGIRHGTSRHLKHSSGRRHLHTKILHRIRHVWRKHHHH
jgi:hypothetical protein